MCKDGRVARKKKLSILAKFRREIGFYRAVLRDRRTPWVSRILLGAAVAYLVSPIDLIPDFIPVIGHLDDLIIVPALVFVAVKMIPERVIREHRRARK